MMSSYFSYLWEANLVLLILYIFYFILLRQKAEPRFNRFFLLFSLLFSLLIPLISIPSTFSLIGNNSNVLSPITEAWNFLPELMINSQKESTQSLLSTLISAVSWIEVLYCSGVIISFILTLLRLYKLYRMIRLLPFTPRHSLNTTYQIAETNGSFPTFSFLNYIFWDNTVAIGPTEQQQILYHELAHIKQRHTLDLLLLEWIRAFFWFNPFLYAYRQSLMQVHEHLADRFAVERSEKESYLQLIVRQTLRQANIPLASLFFQHNTLNRINI